MANWIWGGSPGDIGGRPLRYLLVAELLEADGPCSVAELRAGCERQGVRFTGRPSKVISDALRWEIAAGRIQRVRRGLYTIDHVPVSTRGWIRQRNKQTRAWLAWSAEHGEPDELGGLTESGEWPAERDQQAASTGWVPTWPSLPT